MIDLHDETELLTLGRMFEMVEEIAEKERLARLSSDSDLAEEAAVLDATARPVEAIFSRIQELPAYSAEGFRVKAMAAEWDAGKYWQNRAGPDAGTMRKVVAAFCAA